MIFSAIALIAGLALLLFAGDLLVKGAAGLSENLGISPLVIGLTVVAFGTSAPELLVSLQAALTGFPGIAVGNVIGSNIANVLLVLGLPALFVPVRAVQIGIRRNMTAMLAATAIFMIFLANGMVGRFEGLLLFAGLCAFIALQIRFSRAEQQSSTDGVDDGIGHNPHDARRVSAFLAGGLVGLPLGAYLTVTGASDIAAQFGVPDTVIGLTVVAIGTSLPELATTLAAAARKSSAVAIGNVVGSNIFNIACIMGLTALIKPIPVDHQIVSVDMWVMAGSAVLLAIIGFGRISAGPVVGTFMLAAFTLYIAATIYGGYG